MAVFIQEHAPVASDHVLVGDFWVKPSLGQLQVAQVVSPTVVWVKIIGHQLTAVADVATANGSPIATATPAAAPAGGTGTAAGGWDTAGNRDAAIVTINGLRDVIVEVKTDHDSLVTLVNELKTQVNLILTRLRSSNIIVS